jgi:hypothetical protein
MADSVNRIVPPSVPVDRSSTIGRERDNRKRGEARNKTPAPPAAASTDDEKSLPETGGEKTKGKILDINV